MSGISENSRGLILQKSLDALWQRQQVISGNIANIDTPGYKSRTVAFEALLKSALRAGNGPAGGLESRLSALAPEVSQDNALSMREDGNSVDMDKESVELIRTQFQYQALTAAFSSGVSRLKYAISGGGNK